MGGEFTTERGRTRADKPGVVELIKELRDGLTRLLRLEFRLARAELVESGMEAAKSGLLFAVAVVVALTSWFCLLAAVVVGLQALFTAVGLGLRASLGASFVTAALATAAAAIILAGLGRARLSERRLAPSRAIESIRDVVSSAQDGGDDE